MATPSPDQLIREGAPWAHVSARKCEAYGSEYDDLVGAGYLGLVKAAQKYDPSRGVKFRSFAITYIQGEIHEERRRWHKRSRVSPALNLIADSINNPLSMDEIVREGDDGSCLSLGDTLESTNTGVFEECAAALARRALGAALARLPDRERVLIDAYYYKGMTKREIAVVFGISESRVYQLREQAIARLRNYLDDPAVFA